MYRDKDLEPRLPRRCPDTPIPVNRCDTIALQVTRVGAAGANSGSQYILYGKTRVLIGRANMHRETISRADLNPYGNPAQNNTSEMNFGHISRNHFWMTLVPEGVQIERCHKATPIELRDPESPNLPMPCDAVDVIQWDSLDEWEVIPNQSGGIKLRRLINANVPASEEQKRYAKVIGERPYSLPAIPQEIRGVLIERIRELRDHQIDPLAGQLQYILVTGTLDIGGQNSIIRHDLPNVRARIHWSGKHFWLECVQEPLEVMVSTNGPRLCGIALSPQTLCPLAVGQQIQFGDADPICLNVLNPHPEWDA